MYKQEKQRKQEKVLERKKWRVKESKLEKVETKDLFFFNKKKENEWHQL